MPGTQRTRSAVGSGFVQCAIWGRRYGESIAGDRRSQPRTDRALRRLRQRKGAIPPKMLMQQASDREQLADFRAIQTINFDCKSDAAVNHRIGEASR